jgi:hypothetical protein
MSELRHRLNAAVTGLWEGDRWLTATGMLMLPLLAAFAIGIVVDPRIVTGAPVWLKPAKFAASIAIYTLTLAWAFRYLRDWPRLRRVVGTGTAATLLLEIVIIAAQAGRGTTSHFNVGTPLDATLFAVMGLAIVVQTLLSAAAAIALWRARPADAAMGRALAIGLTITVAGASLGGLMTQPTAAQRDELRRTGRIAIAGAHTVGAPDGEPGLPGTGWSLERGDLRVPHFVGLHAFQALPLVAVLISRRVRPMTRRVRLITIAGASYAGLFTLLAWQALRAQSFARPDGLTLTWFAILATATVTAVVVVLAHPRVSPASAR